MPVLPALVCAPLVPHAALQGVTVPAVRAVFVILVALAATGAVARGAGRWILLPDIVESWSG